MADSKISITVVLDDNGSLKKASSKMKQLGAETEKATKAAKKQGEVYRNQRGVFEATGRANKDFGRMSQGLGGLVQAYATVAANVFALSSAFLVLRRAADLSSMIKSAEDFSNRFGVSVTRITKQIQEATGGAISFAAALPIVNKAVSAGVPIDKMEQLAIAATKASQTFGGTATEALNRFISASQRGRVEIIQTLGIVIKTEKAYEDYGASIGKTAQELSAFDRQQAILNATIEASQSVFDKVNIDPNPFQQLLTTIVDLKDEFSTLVTDFLTPLINKFNESRAAALALIGIIVGSVLKRVTPAAGEAIKAAQQRSIASTQAALKASIKAERLKVRAVREAEEKITDASLKGIRERERAFKASLGNRLKDTSIFAKAVIAENNKIDVATLTSQRALLKKELNLRKAGTLKGRQTLFEGTSDAALKKQLAALELIGRQVDNVNIKLETSARATRNITTETKKLKTTWDAFGASVTATVARTSSLFRTGYAQTFDSSNTTVLNAIGRTNRALLKLGKDIITLNLAGIMTSFGRAAGRALGLISRGLFGILNLASTVAIAVGIGQFVWEKYGDTILGITEKQRQVKDAAEEFSKGLAKANEILAEGIELWGDKAPSSLKDFIDSFTFAAGVFETITNEINQFNKKIVEQFDGKTFASALEELEQLKQRRVELREEFQKTITQKGGRIPAAKIKEEFDEVKKSIEDIDSVLIELSKAEIVTPLINQFEEASKFANTLGISLRNVLENNTSAFSELEEAIGNSRAEALIFAAVDQDFGKLRKEIKSIREEFSANGAVLALLNQSLKTFFSSASGDITSFNRQSSTALKQLQELAGTFNTYSRGLEKLRSQKSPFKEVFGFVLDAENALRDLKESQDKLGSTSLEEAFKAGDLKVDLESIRYLLGNNVETIDDAFDASVRLRKEFQAQLEQQLLGSTKLKVIQQELSNIKAREIGTDKERLKQVADINDQELERVRIQGDIAQANAIAARNQLEALRNQKIVSNEILRTKELEITLLERQRDAANEEEIRLLKFTAHRLELLKIDNEILNNLKERFNLGLQIANIDVKLATNISDIVTFQREALTAQKERLDIEKKLINNNIQRIVVETKEGSLRDRLIAKENARLILLNRQTEELKRQEEITAARELEFQQGGTIFSQEGIKRTAIFFGRALQDQLLGLRSTFEILGEGFVKNINDTFDTAVDNLLEGANDFGKTVREALKATLRETFGDAIKNALRENFSGLGSIFDFFKEDKDKKPIKKDRTAISPILLDPAQQVSPETKQAFEDARLRAERQREFQEGVAERGVQDLNIQQSILDVLINIRDKIISFVSGGSTPGVTGNTSKQNQPLTEIEVTKALRSTPLTVNSVDTVNNSPSQQQAIQQGTDLIASISEGNTSGILQGLVSLGSTIVSAIIAAQSAEAASDTASSIAGAFTGANGGIMTGRSTKLTPMQYGGVVTKPMAALIGEGKNNEAVVPLPNNKEIPVDLRGSGDNVTIEQNFDFRGSDANTVTQLRTEARAIEERTFNRVFDEINKGGRYAKIVGRRN